MKISTPTTSIVFMLQQLSVLTPPLTNCHNLSVYALKLTMISFRTSTSTVTFSPVTTATLTLRH